MTISGPAFNEAIERWKTLNDFGLHAENLSTPGCAPEKSRTLCWYDFGVQYCQDVTAEKDGGSGCLCPCMETLALDDALTFWGSKRESQKIPSFRMMKIQSTPRLT